MPCCNFCLMPFSAYSHEEFRIECNNCVDYALCPDCFLSQCELRKHSKSHPMFLRQASGEIYLEDGWSIDEELWFLDSMILHSLDNFNEHSNHMIVRSAEECRAHYNKFYATNKLLSLENVELIDNNQRQYHRPIVPLNKSLSTYLVNIEIKRFNEKILESKEEYNRKQEEVFQTRLNEELAVLGNYTEKDKKALISNLRNKSTEKNDQKFELVHTKTDFIKALHKEENAAIEAALKAAGENIEALAPKVMHGFWPLRMDWGSADLMYKAERPVTMFTDFNKDFKAVELMERLTLRLYAYLHLRRIEFRRYLHERDLLASQVWLQQTPLYLDEAPPGIPALTSIFKEKDKIQPFVASCQAQLPYAYTSKSGSSYTWEFFFAATALYFDEVSDFKLFRKNHREELQLRREIDLLQKWQRAGCRTRQDVNIYEATRPQRLKVVNDIFKRVEPSSELSIKYSLTYKESEIPIPSVVASPIPKKSRGRPKKTVSLAPPEIKYESTLKEEIDPNIFDLSE